MLKRLQVRRIGEITVYVADEGSLHDLLKKLGLYQDAAEGKARCHFCGAQINLDNVGGIFRRGGQTYLVCNSIKCLYEAAWATKS